MSTEHDVAAALRFADIKRENCTLALDEVCIPRGKYDTIRNEIDRLRAEVERLRAALMPFAEFERVRCAMGGAEPRTGPLFGKVSSAGAAELTVEHFKAARALTQEPK